MQVLTEKRHSIILSMLDEKGSVSVPELCEALDSSESTIRRDLTSLDRGGWLKKVRGGAIAVDSGVILSEPDVVEKKKLFSEEKDIIARYAAKTIRSDDFVFIDAGTTTEKMIPYIKEKGALFVTNAYNHAKLLSKLGHRVCLTGGELKYSTEAVVGVSCIEMLRNYNFTKCFLGTNGISPQSGFTTHDVDEANVKRTACERSYMTYVLADHSKFDKTDIVTFAEISSACIITDRLKNEKYRSLTVIKELNK